MIYNRSLSIPNQPVKLSRAAFFGGHKSNISLNGEQDMMRLQISQLEPALVDKPQGNGLTNVKANQALLRPHCKGGPTK